MAENNFPKLHNAMWPGLVGKGSDSEPGIALDTLLDLTAKAEVNGKKFDGVDIFHVGPHTEIDCTDDDIKRLAEKVQKRKLVIGSIVAPVWPPVGGGSAMGSVSDRKKFVENVRKSCNLGHRLRELGVRPYGIVRIDSAASPANGSKTPWAIPRKSPRPFERPAPLPLIMASAWLLKAKFAGAACTHGKTWSIRLRKWTARTPSVSKLIWPTRFSTPWVTTRRNRDCLPAKFDWKSKATLDEALKKMTDALRPWTIDFHVAQNDGTVKGLGYHDKTGRHCMVTDKNGKLDIPKHAGMWMRGKDGELTKAFKHICWDGCMFPNDVMLQQKTWNDILATMLKVRDKHGWVA